MSGNSGGGNVAGERYDGIGNEIERRQGRGLTNEQFDELKEFVRVIVTQAIAGMVPSLVEQTRKALLASVFEDVGRGAVKKVLSLLGYVLVVVFLAGLALVIGKEHLAKWALQQ